MVPPPSYVLRVPTGTGITLVLQARPAEGEAVASAEDTCTGEPTVLTAAAKEIADSILDSWFLVRAPGQSAFAGRLNYVPDWGWSVSGYEDAFAHVFDDLWDPYEEEVAYV